MGQPDPSRGRGGGNIDDYTGSSANAHPPGIQTVAVSILQSGKTFFLVDNESS